MCDKPYTRLILTPLLKQIIYRQRLVIHSRFRQLHICRIYKMLLKEAKKELLNSLHQV